MPRLLRKSIVTKLRGNVSVLEGSGGNIVVLTGRDGKVLVDAGITGSRLQITEALANLSDDPIKHLINTHWHFDHTDGNEWLHSIGAEITAHENTRKHLAITTRVEDWNFTFPAAPTGALPTKLTQLQTNFASQRSNIGIELLFRRRTRTPIYLSTSLMLTSSMWPTLFGTAISHS